MLWVWLYIQECWVSASKNVTYAYLLSDSAPDGVEVEQMLPSLLTIGIISLIYTVKSLFQLTLNLAYDLPPS